MMPSARGVGDSRRLLSSIPGDGADSRVRLAEGSRVRGGRDQIGGYHHEISEFSDRPRKGGHRRLRVPARCRSTVRRGPYEDPAAAGTGTTAHIGGRGGARLGPVVGGVDRTGAGGGVVRRNISRTAYQWQQTCRHRTFRGQLRHVARHRGRTATAPDAPCRRQLDDHDRPLPVVPDTTCGRARGR